MTAKALENLQTSKSVKKGNNSRIDSLKIATKVQ